METSVIVKATPEGNAEACKESPRGPWHIAYPWRNERYYGTQAAVEQRMVREIKRYKAQVAREGGQ